MTLKEALGYADRAIAKAKEMGLAISLVVIDEFGQLVQLDRMDGAPLMSPDLAEAKALTALNFKQPTSQVAKLRAAELAAVQQVVHFKIVPLAGGQPIYRGGELAGAIGIAGATGAQEDAIAKHAISA
ncbi:MAG TPA: heme-binding protein [Burkholderiales bacterium]